MAVNCLKTLLNKSNSTYEKNAHHAKAKATTFLIFTKDCFMNSTKSSLDTATLCAVTSLSFW